MLCQACASIDLKDVLGKCPESFDEPLLRKHTWTPRILHRISYAAMLDAAQYCQLCAMVVKGFQTTLEFTFHPDIPIYRSVEREGRDVDLYPNQPKRLTVMNFGDRTHGQNFEFDFYGVELYVQEGTKLAIRDDIVGRPIRSAEDPVLLLSWYDQCNNFHQKCRFDPMKDYQMLMPTRVIDVGDFDSSILHLREKMHHPEPYATLSHCWGKTVHNCTTKANLQAYIEGFDISTLCKTMQDAVVVTRNLHLRYLWIDALCIVQDDSKDWEREAMKMSEVYTQSSITIAASSSVDGDGGCFYPRLDGPSAQLRWTLPNESEPQYVSFRGHKYVRYHDMVETAPLNRRAWVVQERSLSRRIVHFTTNRLFWECQECILEEGFTLVPPTYEPPIRGFQLAGNLSKTTTAEGVRQMNTQWNALVEKYTLCQLTHKSDRLPAMAGLATIWASNSGDRYIAGCWQKNLPLSLLWTEQINAPIKTVQPKRIPQYPSWSWASFDGAVLYQPYSSANSMEIVSLIKDVVVVINGSETEKAYGNIREGLLQLTGRVKHTVFDGERETNEYNQHLPWVMKLDAHKHYPHRRASFDNEPILNSPVLMLQLCAYDTEYEGTEFVMLLKPLQEQNHYERLGLGIITWKKATEGRTDTLSSDHPYEESWFADAPQVSLTIS